MAVNLTPQQFFYSAIKGLWMLHAHVAIGATGAPTLQAWNPNTRAYSTASANGTASIKSITRTATGLYTVTLQSAFQRLLGLQALFTIAGGTSVIVSTQCNSTLTNVNSSTAPAVAICTMSSTATAADPDSGSTMDLMIYLQSSSAI